ncbi:MAG: SDR family oxidoreductase [Desulfobacula sp.]|nr:SDR family oxidoreductase [Desulfobacula sp.]
MVNPLDLTKQRILVTGASSGIGRSTAVLLSRLGADIVLAGRSKERLQETYNQLSSGNHCLEPYDLAADVNGIPGWIKKIAEIVGPFQGLAHCAGIEYILPVLAITHEKYDELMRINTEAAFFLAKGFRQKKCHKEGASIVFIASVAGIIGQAGLSIYSASKGALISLTKALAIEFARNDIRVNSISPGHIETAMGLKVKSNLPKEQYESIINMHPLGLGSPEDVANAVAFLLAETGRWITGTNLVVDGGYTAH